MNVLIVFFFQIQLVNYSLQMFSCVHVFIHRIKCGRKRITLLYLPMYSTSFFNNLKSEIPYEL